MKTIILTVAVAVIAVAGSAEARGSGGGHHASGGSHRSYSSRSSRSYSHGSGSRTVRASGYQPSHAYSDSSAYYTNVDGERVHRPVHASRAPGGASAQCGDGSYSFSRHARGTCSHHGGVASWR